VAVALPAGAASAGNPTIERHPVYGGAEAFFGGCPDTEETPPAGTVCVESHVLVWRGYDVLEGGSIARAKAPWNVFAETVRVEFTSAEEPDVTVLRFGFGELDGDAAVDTVHLTVASADFRLPMSDGSTFDFAGSWSAVGGPATGAPRHVVDKCTTFNALGHQKFRFASMTGTLNGDAVHSYTATPAATIFNNHFTYIDVPHGACA
jgi:hypothetical protein